MALTDNLVAYYKYDSNANDSTANAYHGTPGGSISFSNAGKISNCATFPGDNTKISYPSGLEAQLGGAFTYAAWFKLGAGFNLQWCCAWTGGKLNLLIALDSSVPKIYLYRGNGGSGQGSEVSAALGTTGSDRHHFVVTQTGTTVAMYKDGNALSVSGSVGYSGGVSNQTLQTGFYNDYGTYSGYMDEFGIWSRALSSTEVTTLYNGGSGLTYPFITTSIKTINGLAYSSVKTINGLAVTSVKTFNGLA